MGMATKGGINHYIAELRVLVAMRHRVIQSISLTSSPRIATEPQMSRLFLVAFIIGLAQCPNAAAQEAVLTRTSVSELIDKSMQTKDGTYMAIALGRCSSLLKLIQGVMKRDANRDVYPEIPELFQLLAQGILKKKLDDRGVEVDERREAEIEESVIDTYNRYYKAYLSRMTGNWESQGDYWSSDVFLLADIKACSSMANEFTED